MGSSYSCIVTREEIKVPREIPHFWKKDVLTIPVDCDQWGVIDFLKFYKRGELIFAESTNSAMDANPPHSSNIETLSDDAKMLFSFLEDLGLLFGKFMVMYMSDHADIPTESFHGVFDKGDLIMETYYSDYEDISGEMDAALESLEVTYYDIHFADYYRNAASEYIEVVFKPGLWRI